MHGFFANKTEGNMQYKMRAIKMRVPVYYLTYQEMVKLDTRVN